MLFIWQQVQRKTNKRKEILPFTRTHRHTRAHALKRGRVAACFCQVASTGLAGGLRPDFMGQVSTLEKPQAPFPGSLAAAAPALTRALSASGESLGRNSGMEVGRTRGRVCCAAGQSPLMKHVGSLDNSLVLLGKREPWRWPGPLESV